VALVSASRALPPLLRDPDVALVQARRALPPLLRDLDMALVQGRRALPPLLLNAMCTPRFGHLLIFWILFEIHLLG